MFGILFSLTLIICSIGLNIKNQRIDHKKRIHNRIEGTDDLYWDHNMIAREIETNRPRIVHRNKSGDLCKYDEGMNLLKNYDESRRIKDYCNSYNIGEIHLIDNDRHSTDKVKGRRYAMVGSDRVLVKRRIYLPERQVVALYYMDVNTLELVCSLDRQINPSLDNYIKKKWRQKCERAKKDKSGVYADWYNLDCYE